MRIHIVGAGDVGQYMAQQLSALNNDVILIDSSSTALARVEEQLDVMTVQGNATYRKVLIGCKVDESDLFVSVTSNDYVNVLSASLAAKMGAKKTIASVDSPNFFFSERGLERGLLDTTLVACAPRMIGYELLRRFRKSHLVDALNFAENSLSVAVGKIDANPHFKNADLTNIRQLKEDGLSGVIRDQQYYSSSEIAGVYSSDLLVIVGPHASYAEARRKILLEENDHSVFVIGGGDVGGELALLLAQDGLSVTVIEISRSRCETLANAYPHIQIVHGDGTNVLALTDEHLERGRALFAVTKADEVNLMSSLLAKDLGVPLTYSLVHRPDYATVYEKLGVTATTGAHHMLYRTVDWINSKASVMQSLPLAVPNLEISEVYIRAASELAGHLVSDLSLPHGAKLIGGFINGAYFDGDSNPKFEHQGYYLFVGPKGLGSLLDERLSKLR